MTSFVLEPGAKLGVKMPDGTTYRPSRRGVIEVDDKKHIAQLRSKNSATNLGLMVEKRSMPRVATGKVCPKCVFAGWAWTITCPRCGEVLE